MTTEPMRLDQENDLLAKIVNRSSVVFGVPQTDPARAKDGEWFLWKQLLEILNQAP